MPRTLVKTIIRYPLIWDQGTLEVQIEDCVVEVSFRREYCEGCNGMEILNDRDARVARTAVDVLMPEQMSLQEALAKTHSALNRLLEVYRVATQEAFIDRVPLSELSKANLFLIDDEGNLQGNIEVDPENWTGG